MNKKLFAFLILAILLISGKAYAAVTHADGDIYSDAYTVESSSGNWEFDGNITLNTGSLTISTGTGVVSKYPITVISTTTSTSGAVTAAKTGYTFVLDPPAGGQSSPPLGYILTLPSAFLGAQYTFITATNSTLSVKTSNSQLFNYSPGGSTCLSSPASSGSTLTVIGGSGEWYIKSMSSGSGSDATSVNYPWTQNTTI